MPSALLLIPLLASMAAAGTDLARFRIPNAITLGLALAFLPAAWLAGLDMDAMIRHLGAGAAMFALGIAFFFFRFWGGGDAKLFGALSLWLGWQPLMAFVVAMVLAGGVLALLLLGLRRLPWPETWRRNKMLRRHLAARAAVPYGVAMALGMVWVLLHV
ncbi:MAG: prepilin peptidase [Alphaproteobacteria bacterium]|nr:prepilin peptidase [Alphaproteobacteria bacterium]